MPQLSPSLGLFLYLISMLTMLMAFIFTTYSMPARPLLLNNKEKKKIFKQFFFSSECGSML